MQRQINKRLDELNGQFEQGNARLIRIENERTQLRETLLRIQGAILALNEFSARDRAQDNADDAAAETAEIRLPVEPDDEQADD